MHRAIVWVLNTSALCGRPFTLCPAVTERILLSVGLPVAGQVQEGVRGDRNHGEPQPGPAGERLTRPRGRALPGPQLEERGAFQWFFFVFFFFVFVCGALTVCWCVTSPPRTVPPVSRAYFPLLLVSVTLSSAVNLWLHSLPSFPLFLHLFHSLNPITFSLLRWPLRRDD